MGALPPNISIIVCTNRAPETINRLFNSISNQISLDQCEVILVDNGIAKSRVEEVRMQLAQLQCRSFYLDEPRPGLWYARMSAFVKARGEWFMLLDDDNELAETAIEHLLSFVGKHPEVGGISPRVVARWERMPATWLQRFGTCCLSYTESGQHSPSFGEMVWSHPKAPGIRPPGGGMIVHRRIAEAFLTSFSLLPVEITQPTVPCEDHAIYCGVGKCAMDSAYVPTIVVYHCLDSSRTSLSALSRLNYRMIRGYGKFTVFESMFSGYYKGWFRLSSGFIMGELRRLTLLHPKIWWLVLVRLVAFMVGGALGIVLRSSEGENGCRAE